MIQLQIRVLPEESLLDIDVPMIEERVAGCPEIAAAEVIDDRAADAPFVTVLVTLTDDSEEVFTGVRETLLDLPGMIPCVVDEEGEEHGCGSLETRLLRRHARER